MKVYSGGKRHQTPGPSLPQKPISRRRFLKEVSAVAAGLLAAGCLPNPPPETPLPTSTPILTPNPTFTPTAAPTGMPTGAPTGAPTYPPTTTPTAVPTSTPTVPPTATPTVAPTATPTIPPSATPTVAPTAIPTPPYQSRVAIAQANSYDRNLMRQQVQAMLDGLGGLDDLISPGDRVAIKPNLTGGTGVQPLPGVPAIESYVTHPEVVRGLGELLRDAGAGQLFIVEAIYDWESYRSWGYEEVANALGATLIDLNVPQPYADFVSVPVGSGPYVYDAYTVNPILQEIDAFVSVAKMKCHWSCGITLSMKNLIGLVPVTYYRCNPDDWYRSDLHACDGNFVTRLPGSVVDLTRVRPIQLALIDGIKTVEAGEGPWVETMAPVEPGLLVAGKNPVSTDAVSAAVMGFDPTVDFPAQPFLRSDNHLSMAHDSGLGTHRLEEIEVVGAPIEDVRFPFEPA